MDFAVLPPEVNSGRMYAGPGSGSLLAAAAAWDELAVELHAAAASYRSVVTELTSGAWLGASSTKMAAAAAPYASWLSATAEQAELTGAQAKAAAAAHANAFAMTVAPPLIAANRAQLATLVATNFFGQNAPAIAAIETYYAEMWAQDASAMYGYAAAAQAASQMTPFSAPPQTADPAGVAASGAAATEAVGDAAGQASVSEAMQALSGTLPSSAEAMAAEGSVLHPAFGDLATLGASPVSVMLSSAIIAAFIPEYLIAGAALPSPFGLEAAAPAAIAAGLPLGLTPTLGSAGLASATSAASAAIGNAASVSGLSVPRAWAVEAPEMRLAAAELEAPSLATGTSSMLSGMPLLGGAPLMGMGPRGSAAVRAKDDQNEEAKRKAAKGRRSSMW